jgi:hypothetical protein
MKAGHFYFELLLMLITLVAGITFTMPGNDGIVSLIWLFLLGVFQVIHSLVIGFTYRNNKKISDALALYWSGVIIDFILIFINAVFWNKDLPFVIHFIILPLLLAVYLFGITYYFSQKNKVSNPTG